MAEPTPDFTGMESQLEALFFAPLRHVRQKLFGPLIILLARLGISADTLSFATLIPALGFCLLAPTHLALAFWLMITSLALDSLDGVLARYTQTSSLSGAFTDTCCDLCVLALWIAGLAWRGTIHSTLAIFFLFTYTTMGIFFLLHHLLNVSTRWLIRPGKTFFCLAFGVEVFFHIHLLNYLFAIYLLTLPFLGLSFWRLKKALLKGKAR